MRSRSNDLTSSAAAGGVEAGGDRDVVGGGGDEGGGQFLRGDFDGFAGAETGLPLGEGVAADCDELLSAGGSGS